MQAFRAAAQRISSDPSWGNEDSDRTQSLIEYTPLDVRGTTENTRSQTLVSQMSQARSRHTATQ